MSQYTSEYPAIKVEPSVKDFFERFYKISDNPEEHEEYANHFTKNAIFKIASKEANGYDEILSLRRSMWEKVATRSHKPIKVFPFGENANEVMLFGTVAYTFKAGGSSSLDFAAWGHVVQDGGVSKLDNYQVYLDSAAQAPSK